MAERRIIQELYRTVVLLGGESDLLGLIGSWGDSLPDEDVLAGLQAWNAGEVKEITERIAHYETSGPRSGCSAAVSP